MLNGMAFFDYVILQNDIICMFIVRFIRAKSFLVLAYGNDYPSNACSACLVRSGALSRGC